MASTASVRHDALDKLEHENVILEHENIQLKDSLQVRSETIKLLEEEKNKISPIKSEVYKISKGKG